MSPSAVRLDDVKLSNEGAGISSDVEVGDRWRTNQAAPLLSVLIPVWNERETIARIVRRVLDVSVDLEVIVVDDGSTDGTPDLLESFTWPAQVRLLRHSQNRGKGAAVRTALAAARGRFVIVQDGDLEYDPADIPALLAPLLAEEAEVVYGSRYLNPTCRQPFRWLRWGVWGLNQVVRGLYGVKLTDCATCYKCLPADLLRSLELREDRFGFCAELTARLCRAGVPILEVPITYAARTVKAGKKLRARDGWDAFRILWRHRKWRSAVSSVRAVSSQQSVSAGASSTSAT